MTQKTIISDGRPYRRIHTIHATSSRWTQTSIAKIGQREKKKENTRTTFTTSGNASDQEKKTHEQNDDFDDPSNKTFLTH
jgi:hypothetical protein